MRFRVVGNPRAWEVDAGGPPGEAVIQPPFRRVGKSPLRSARLLALDAEAGEAAEIDIASARVTAVRGRMRVIPGWEDGDALWGPFAVLPPGEYRVEHRAWSGTVVVERDQLLMGVGDSARLRGFAHLPDDPSAVVLNRKYF